AAAVATCPSRTCEAAVVGVPRTSKRSLMEIGTPCSGPRSCPAASSWSARSASRRACAAITRTNAFNRGFSASIRSRQVSSVAAAVVCLARRRRAKSSMVKGFTRVGDVVGVTSEAGAAEQFSRLRQTLEQRFQLWQAAPLGVGNGGFQPVFYRHDSWLGPPEGEDYVLD